MQHFPLQLGCILQYLNHRAHHRSERWPDRALDQVSAACGSYWFRDGIHAVDAQGAEELVAAGGRKTVMARQPVELDRQCWIHLLLGIWAYGECLLGTVSVRMQLSLG